MGLEEAGMVNVRPLFIYNDFYMYPAPLFFSQVTFVVIYTYTANNFGSEFKPEGG